MEIALVAIPLVNTYVFLSRRSVLTSGKEGHVNYRGLLVPKSGGVIFLFSYAAAFLGSLVLSASVNLEMLSILYLIVGLAFIGLLDDSWGDGTHKGFRGHFKAFFLQGQISTGFIKAVFGAVFSFSAAAMFFTPGTGVLVAGLIIALSSNAFNSLDLRPGRALKVFFIFSLLLMGLTREGGPVLLLIPLLTTLVLYLPWELKEKIMLGDSGANILGGVLGFVFVLYYPLSAQVYLLLALVLFQVYCEVYSVSKLISKNAFLRFFDNLGRAFPGEVEK